MIAAVECCKRLCTRLLEFACAFSSKPRATDDLADLAGVDYLIVAVKGYSLPEVRDAIACTADSGSVVVPLLNGVDVAERLESLASTDGREAADELKRLAEETHAIVRSVRPDLELAPRHAAACHEAVSDAGLGDVAVAGTST